MSLQIIASNEPRNPVFPKDSPYLQVSEFFCDTIQGEGVYTGHPAAFLRLQGCTLECSFCDSIKVWKKGNPYTYNELYEKMEAVDLIRKFKEGQHLVITGGSPLLQQYRVEEFIRGFIERYGFKPFIELENEAVLDPIVGLIYYVDCWNNSPKLESSGNKRNGFNPTIIHNMSNLPNNWFKFVVGSIEDWYEIERGFLKTDLILRNQIILMPLGGNYSELIKNRQLVVDISIKNNVRYSTREHVILWNLQTGV